MTPLSPRKLTSLLRDEARRLGFDLVGIAPAVSPEGFQKLEEWLGRGYAGEMGYLERRKAAYRHPDELLSGARSVVMLALNYYTGDAAPQTLPPQARVSRYAWGSGDYHALLRERMGQLADFLHQHAPECATRRVVDTAPLLERDFARLAGLGWFGKNTMLLNKRLGSWFFLGALLTDAELEPDAPHETAHCGTCTRCLDACPTDAFVGPYVLDATRCISYLTIELRYQPVPVDLRSGIGDWLFGCDVCQDVCPWNHKAPVSTEEAFRPRGDLAPADCIALLALTQSEFDARFDDTPLARPGRSGLLRNACLVLGNAACVEAVPALERVARDSDPLIRDAAEWALMRINETAAMEPGAAVAHNRHSDQDRSAHSVTRQDIHG